MDKSRHVGPTLRKLHNQILRGSEMTSSEFGLSLSQGRVLHFIYIKNKEGDCFQGEIEDYFNIRRSSATALLQKLEARNLIKRESSKNDKRQKVINITEHGVEIQELVFEKLSQMETLMIKGISKDQIDNFYFVMDKMTKNLIKGEEVV